MMTPTTFDMPDAIDEPVDEMQELLSEEQAGNEEPASELGHVEDGEPGQDWNAEGVFIGAAEIIEVPFRRTVKSKATVRVVLDREDGNYWRSGWHWKTLLKNDSGKPAEVGKELSREFIGYESKAKAVHAALNYMASHAMDFDKRIADDILKFRDIDWHATDSGPADDGEPADGDEPMPRHATEPRANAFDVLDTDIETVGIPLPKKLKVTASMDLAEDSHGWWYFGYCYEFGGNRSSGPPKLDGDKFPSRKQAQCAALRHAIGHYTPLDMEVADKIAVLLGTTERNATEIITAKQVTEWVTTTDPETKAAIDELGIAGVSVGEPVASAAAGTATQTEDELQAKAEADFRRKYVAAAELMADAVLERRHAEAIFKTAKAKEKCCAEMLEQLADRGPERLPIVEYAERSAAASAGVPEQVKAAAEAKQSDAWKSASVTELDLPKGVESKLIEDGIDTIGRLEQRRADVAMKKEKYPAGIGKAAIDKIEDAVLAWLKVNQYPDQATEVEPVEPTSEAATEATSDRVIDPEIGDVEARVKELSDWPADSDNGSYQSGRDAFGTGSLLTDCPLTIGDEQDQWLMGWSDAKEAAGELDQSADSSKDVTDAADDLGDL